MWEKKFKYYQLVELATILAAVTTKKISPEGTEGVEIIFVT